MNTVNNLPEKQFCIWCGNEIKHGSNFCPKCGKKQIEEENPLIDWLIAHTKDKLKSDAESSLFEALKNFILSHLYGTLMSIAIITAAGVTIYAGEPHIEKYSDADAPKYILDALYGTTTNSTSSDYSQMMNSDVHNLCNEYMRLVHNVGKENRDGDIISVDHLLVSQKIYPNRKYDDVSSEIMANSYNYTGVQQSGSYEKTIFELDQFQMYISKELSTNGFTVGECIVYEELENLSSGKAVYSSEILFSCALVEDEWYIAGVNLISQYKDDSFFYEIDEGKIKTLIESYVEAIYSGSDLSDIVFEIPAEIDSVPRQDIYTITEEYPENYGYTVYVGLSHYSSAYSPADQLESMGYTVLGANVRITINISENQKYETSHNFTFVDIDGQYMVVGDVIQSRTLTS